MASIGKIARRTFLIGSAAFAGGVAFGVYAAVNHSQTQTSMTFRTDRPASIHGSLWTASV